MGGLVDKATRFARSPKGKQALRQAMGYAKSPKGRARVAKVRDRVAAARSRRGPRKPG